MNKFPTKSKTISIVIRPEDEAMKPDLEFIARKTTGGGITSMNIVMLNMLRMKCQEKLNLFAAMDEVTNTLAERFEKAIAPSFRR